MKLHSVIWNKTPPSFNPTPDEQAFTPLHLPNARANRLVFLHGMGGTAKLWRPIAASLEDFVEVVALDQRGHGLSRPVPTHNSANPATYTPLDYGRDIIETLDLLSHPNPKNSKQNCWLIGHSMGVRSACAAAHLAPERFQGLVLIDLGLFGPAGGGLGDDLANFLKKLPSRFESRLEARDFMHSECPDPSIAHYLMAVSETDVKSGNVTFPFDQSALIQTIEAVRNTGVRDWLIEFALTKKPVYLLRGEKSLVWDQAEFEEEKTKFKNFSNVHFIEYEGAGHGLPFEKRIKFVEDLKKWVLL